MHKNKPITEFIECAATKRHAIRLIEHYLKHLDSKALLSLLGLVESISHDDVFLATYVIQDLNNAQQCMAKISGAA